MKHVATVAVVSLLLASSLSGQAPKRALTIEDYYRIKTIGDAQISPNGQWVAYSLSTRIEDDNTTSTETYVVNADGSGTARRITHAGDNVASPRWTDDNLLSYSLNARVASAVFVGPGGPAGSAAPRANAAGCKIAVDSPNATPVESPAAPAGRDERRWQMDRAGQRRRATHARRGRGDRLREASCGSVQGPDVRLDAVPGRRPGLSDSGSAPEAGCRDHDRDRRGRHAQDDHVARHAPRERGLASQRQRRSRSPPTKAGRTSRVTSIPTSTPSPPTAT